MRLHCLYTHYTAKEVADKHNPWTTLTWTAVNFPVIIVGSSSISRNIRWFSIQYPLVFLYISLFITIIPYWLMDLLG